jgi:hypothetical protein
MCVEVARNECVRGAEVSPDARLASARTAIAASIGTTGTIEVRRFAFMAGLLLPSEFKRRAAGSGT